MDDQLRHWAPVALFIYNRPKHAQEAIETLRANAGFSASPLHVFADGPKHRRDAGAVRETRAVARELLGESASFVERDTNIGLDRSIISGVAELCERYGKVVVVEDDLRLSPMFLAFMNAALRRYEGDTKVMQISGHMYDVPGLAETGDALFLPMTTSWGWATWKRAWDAFDPDASGWGARFRDAEERRRFDLGGHAGYAAMLGQQMRRDTPAWDIRWYYTVFVRSGLVLHPPRTLVLNAGFDGSGTHSRLSSPPQQGALEMSAEFGYPGTVALSPFAERVFEAVGTFHSRRALHNLAAAPKAILRRARRAIPRARGNP